MSNCLQTVNHSKIKCEERQSKFILLNPNQKRVDKITVDGCIYKKGSPDLRCDYALNYDNTTVFVELKGNKLKHAIEQVLATKQDAKFTIKSTTVAVIITTKTPQNDSSTQKQKIILMKQQIKLVPGNTPLTKTMGDL